MKILIVCHNLVLTGGLMRFERFGRVAAAQGHDIVFAKFDVSPPPYSNGFRLIGIDEAAAEQWDVTMIPGAGLPRSTIDDLSRLKTPAFGIRVQHILNDTSRREAFSRVHRAFEPDIVILNNRHWSSEDLAAFAPARIHVIEGAVDLNRFRANGTPAQENSIPPFVVGGQTRKNPAVLLDALRRLPRDIQLHLFGSPGSLETVGRDLIANGRLWLTGPLRDDELPKFYAALHCVVHVETTAGWANLVAEAMAARVAVICTSAGTLPLASNNQTALVLPGPDPGLITEAVIALKCDAELRRRLVENASERIQNGFSWSDYTTQLLGHLASP